MSNWWHRARSTASLYKVLNMRQSAPQKPLKVTARWQTTETIWTSKATAGSGNQCHSSAWHEFWSAYELNGFRLQLISLSWSKTEVRLLKFLPFHCHYTAESQELSNYMNNIYPYLIQWAVDNCLSSFPSVYQPHETVRNDHTEYRQIHGHVTTLQIRNSPCLKWRKRADSSKHKKLER